MHSRFQNRSRWKFWVSAVDRKIPLTEFIVTADGVIIAAGGTGRFNRRHQYFGHLFSGRYKLVVIDERSPGYLRTACDDGCEWTACWAGTAFKPTPPKGAGNSSGG